MNALTRYRVSEKSLTVAKTINEVTEICNYYEGMARTARKLKNREAEIEAADFVMRAKRKLGILMDAARKTGALKRGSKRGQKVGVKKPQPRARSAPIESGAFS